MTKLSTEPPKTTSCKHKNSGLIGLIDVGQANEIDTKIEKGDRSDTYNMQNFSIYNISNDILSSTKNDEIEILNSCENWRGKAGKRFNSPDQSPEKTKRAKPFYLDTCPEWEYIKNAKVSRLPCLTNGSFCKPLVVNDITLNLKNTCALIHYFN